MSTHPSQSGNRDNVPDWAGFFSGEEFRIFMAEVRQDFAGRGVPHEVDPVVGVIKVQPSLQLGLHNLAQTCRASGQSEWPTIIRDHFSRILQMGNAHGEFVSELKWDFARARKLLRVRLYPSDMAGQEWSICRPVADGILAMLVYDLPQSVVNVQREHAVQWGVSDDALFEEALRNIRTEGMLQRSPVDVGEGVIIEMLSGESFYLTSHVLFLKEYLGTDHPLGALVSIPHRQMVLLHPIEDARIMDVLRPLLYLTPAMYADGPGSVSDKLYWWHDGTFTNLPYAFDPKENTASFLPPREFVEGVIEKVTGPLDEHAAE